MVRRTVPNDVASYTITTTTTRMGSVHGRRSYRTSYSTWSNCSIKHKNRRISKHHGSKSELYGAWKLGTYIQRKGLQPNFTKGKFVKVATTEAIHPSLLDWVKSIKGP